MKRVLFIFTFLFFAQQCFGALPIHESQSTVINHSQSIQPKHSFLHSIIQKAKASDVRGNFIIGGLVLLLGGLALLLLGLVLWSIVPIVVGGALLAGALFA